MKALKIIPLILFILTIRIAVSAQHNHGAMVGGSSSNMNMNQDTHAQMMQIKTESLKVSGKCQMCKARIEKIASEYGAASTDWDIKTQLLTIVFDPSVTNIENINYKLLKAGHFSGEVRAKDKAYHTLPECCKYSN